MIWNFEICSDNLLDSSQLLRDEKDAIHWEVRFFWPGDAIIILHGLEDRFLLLSNYQIKRREDRYVLLPDCYYNIKRRNAQLLYKPLLKQAGNLQGYGKKINLAHWSNSEILPGTDHCDAASLLVQVQKSAQEVAVEKEAVIYKFPSKPATKLELARLQMGEKIYFSACIEGRSQDSVTRIARHLLGGEAVSSDYVHFLKKIRVF